MDIVTARINQVDLLLPNPALMSSSGAAISRAMVILRPVIMDERVVHFINNIPQQDMRTELLKGFWTSKGADPLPDFTDRTYLTSLSLLLASPGIPHPDRMRMFDELDRVFNATQEDDLKAEAADITHRFFPARGERMLDELRQILNIDQQQIYQNNEELIIMIRGQQPITPEQVNNRLHDLRRIAQGKRTVKVVYDDLQNVHNTTINESVIAAARALIEEMVATVTFDGRYKFKVFRDDTVKSITHRLANVLKRFPEEITILGDNDKQELQPRMTYRIPNDAKSTAQVSRFKLEDTDKYMDVIGLEDYIFPKHVVRDGELGRRLEEIFLVTNRYLTDASFDDNNIYFYLELCGIPDASTIWFDRDDILNDLYAVIGNEVDDTDVSDFLDEVFHDFEHIPESFIRRIKTGVVRDVKLLDLLNAVWKFIHTKQGEIFTEMKKRLKEEITEAMDVCTSGVCAHLVSVIQGYFDEIKQPSLRIKMSVVDEMRAKLTQNINKLAIEKEIDPVMDHKVFKTIIDEYIDTKELLNGFTDHDIIMNGLSKQMITEIAYKIYALDETDDGTADETADETDEDEVDWLEGEDDWMEGQVDWTWTDSDED